MVTCNVLFSPATDSNALQRAMREGITTVAIVKVLLIGPPGTGKTCTKHLLLDLPPPDKRNSTPIATRAARAISVSRFTTDSSEFVMWKKLDSNTYLDFIIQEVKLLDQQPPPAVPSSPLPIATSPATDGSETQQPSTVEARVICSNDQPAHSNGDKQFPVTRSTEEMPPQDPRYSAEGWAESVGKILTRMEVNQKPSKKPQKKQFVHLVDSGGQPAFVSLVPAFIRGSTVNVVATKLNQYLKAKLPYEFVKDGKHLRKPTDLEQTQLELVEELVRSLSSVQHSKISCSKYSTQSKFLILGTHADKHWPSASETLAGKNRKLKEKLGKLMELCIESDPDGGIIHPVNTLVMKNRVQFAASIRQKIMEACSGAEVDIPTRWYIFELEVGSTAKKEGRPVLGLVECLLVGKKVDMQGEDVIAAIVFLDEVTICLYFRDAVPHLVFTDAQAILSELSELMNLGIIDLELIPTYYPLLADHKDWRKIVLKLRKKGLFSRELVALVCQKFRVRNESKCSYTEEDFLAILKHLLIVASMTIDGMEQYFLPSILPTISSILPTIKKVLPSVGDFPPLLLTCHTRVIPLGMFPALVVSLLDRSMSPRFELHEIQYRNAISLCCPELGGVVYLIESIAWLEVRYNGKAAVASRIRVALHKALASVCKQRQYDTKQVAFKDGFWCPFGPQCDNSPHLCEVVHSTRWLTCSVNPDIGSGECSDAKKLAWLTAPTSELCDTALVHDECTHDFIYLT